MKMKKKFYYYNYLTYKAKVIFSYHGFIGEDRWFEFEHYKLAGLQRQPAGFAGQFLYLNWSDAENKNLVDIETYKILYEIDTQLGVEPTGQLHSCLQYCLRADILELTPIDEKIDFNIIGRDGMNIFKQCFAPGLRNQETRHGISAGREDEFTNVHSKNYSREKEVAYIQRFQKKLRKQNLLVPAIEDRFFKLVKAGEKYGFDIDAIMEKPALLGSTVFETASIFSVRICKFILSRKIRINHILVNFIYPVFPMHDPLFDGATLEKMLKKGINPKIISGKNLELINRSLT